MKLGEAVADIRGSKLKSEGNNDQVTSHLEVNALRSSQKINVYKELSKD